MPNDGSLLRANVTDTTPTITWVGHSTFVVQIGWHDVFDGPNLVEHAKSGAGFGPRRFVPPGIAIEDLPTIDFVTISHNHYDHLDLPTLRALAARDPGHSVFCP